MTLWIDAHLSPLIAAWLTWTFVDVQAVPLRDLGLRDAEDEEIFQAAKAAGVVVLTKDADFRHLLNQFGPPPQGTLAHLRQHIQRAAASRAARHPARRLETTGRQRTIHRNR